MNRQKSPINSGEPCKRHNCVKCCINTKMPLTSDDIKRIVSLGFKTEDFAVKAEGEWRLRNRKGKCYFLTENGCKIYNSRPEGCKLYPLVFDEDSGKPILDELCPYREEFKPEKSDIERLMKLIERLAMEKLQK